MLPSELTAAAWSQYCKYFLNRDTAEHLAVKGGAVPRGIPSRIVCEGAWLHDYPSPGYNLITENN